MKKPELKQDENGIWYVKGSVGYVEGNVGYVWGNVGDVRGTISGQDWQYVIEESDDER